MNGFGELEIKENLGFVRLEDIRNDENFGVNGFPVRQNIVYGWFMDMEILISSVAAFAQVAIVVITVWTNKKQYKLMCEQRQIDQKNYEDSYRRQQKQFEEQMIFNRRTEELKIRPYFAFAGIDKVEERKNGDIVFRLGFVNRGMGIAIEPSPKGVYNICTDNNVYLDRLDAVKNEIVPVDEELWIPYIVRKDNCEEGIIWTYKLCFRDAFENNYQQDFHLIIHGDLQYADCTYRRIKMEC